MISPEFSESEILALQRFIRREKLGPAARHSLRKAEKKIRQHDEYIRSGNRDEDLDMHAQYLYDEYLKAGGRTDGVVPPARYGSGPTPAARRAAGSGRRSSPPAAAGGGALRASAPPRSPAPGPSLAEGGGGAFDAMTASPEQYARKLALLGVSLAPGSVDEHANKRRGSTTNEVALQLAEAQAKKRDRKLQAQNAARAAEIDEARRAGTEFDAMDPDVSPDEVRAVLADQGIVDPTITDSFRRHGEKTLRPKEPPPPTKEQQARARRDQRLLGEVKAGKGSAMRLSDAAYEALLKARGLQTSGTWPWERSRR